MDPLVRAMRVNWEGLVEAPVRKIFNSHLRERLEGWNLNRPCSGPLLQTASRCCGLKDVGAYCGSYQRTCW